MANERKIIHIDMDCFYAAVEMLDFPELVGKPIAIGGGERGVLSTSNYEARKFGVRSAMPTRTALKLCPHLILRPHRGERYRELSKMVREVFLKHTDLIEPLSLDEAFLDVTNNKDYAGSATWLAKAIKKEIKDVTGLTASAGVAPNKFLAKIASDWEKPNGLFTITPDEVNSFVKDLPVGKIFGVGKVSQEALKRWNIHTCGDLQSWTKEELVKEFGNSAITLYNYARGIDNRPVSNTGERKSLSVESTFLHDKSLDELHLELPKIYKEFLRRYNELKPEKKLPIKTIYVKLKTLDFEVSTMDQAYTMIPDPHKFHEMLDSIYPKKDKLVRLMGLGVRFEEKDSLRSLQQNLF